MHWFKNFNKIKKNTLNQIKKAVSIDDFESKKRNIDIKILSKIYLYYEDVKDKC